MCILITILLGRFNYYFHFKSVESVLSCHLFLKSRKTFKQILYNSAEILKSDIEEFPEGFQYTSTHYNF